MSGSKEESESSGSISSMSSGLETIALMYLGTAYPADVGNFSKSTLSVICDLVSLHFTNAKYNQMSHLTAIPVPLSEKSIIYAISGSVSTE